MVFFFFLLLNAVLFIRPEELFPELVGLQLYQALILVCLALAGPSVLRQLTWKSLTDHPVTFCVVGLLGAAILSQVVQSQIGGACSVGESFGKVVLYYLLFVGVVNTPARLRWFLVSLLGFVMVVSCLALLQYRGWIHIAALNVLEQREIDLETGDAIVYARLRSTGIFNDPNDLCLILSAGILVAVYLCGEKKLGPRRFLVLPAMGIFAYALMLTQSRGGLLGLLSGLLVVSRARWGWKKTLLGAALCLPLLLLVAAGRQTDLGTGEGTSQERIQKWSEGLDLFGSSPFFGIGVGEFADHVGLVAHNSFVHCYAEMGFLGGTLFFGAFAFAALTLSKGASSGPSRADENGRLRPYLTALLSAYAVGLFSLSRAYVVPTYMVLAIAVSYTRLASAGEAGPVLRLDWRSTRWLLCGSVLCVLILTLFVHFSVRWS